MQTDILPLSQIAVEKSIYRFLAPSADADGPFTALLERSLQSRGVETPIVVHRRDDGSAHLVDGFKRASLASKLGIPKVPCRVIAGAELPELLDLLVSLRFGALTASAAASAEFLAFADSLGAGEPLLVDRLLPALGLEPHPSVLERCRAVAALPAEIRAFCREKRFSLKQCARLAAHPRDLATGLFAWQGEIALTASILEELLERVGDYLRAERLCFADFAALPEVRELIASREITPAEKTEELRRTVRELRLPTLSAINAEMDRIVSDLALPGSVRVTWDRTLEIRELSVSAVASSLPEWSRIAGALADEGFSRAVGELLDRL